MVNTIFITLLLIASGIFAYMSAHITEEQRKGKRIPLFWEKTNKVKRHMNNLPERREDKPGSKIASPRIGPGKFDMQRVHYSDGDNT
jgi:hypothetical protein